MNSKYYEGDVPPIYAEKKALIAKYCYYYDANSQTVLIYSTTISKKIGTWGGWSSVYR